MLVNIFERIELAKVLPVAVIDRADDAIPLVDALARGGLSAIEVTFRTDAAADAIRLIRAKRPNILVGAGTVLTAKQARSAADVGAQFLVAPGLNADTVCAAADVGLPFLPGVLTPSELERAMSLGLERVKFFPAEAGGGVAMLKAMSAPYRAMKFMPTGGINAENLLDYLALDCVFACGLSSVCERGLLSDGDFAEIERRAGQIKSLLDTLKRRKNA